MIYLQMFFAFFQIGLFSFGGGYAAVPLIQHQIIEVYGWITLSEFADLITISEMTPGPIAINSATVVGTLVAGLPGAIIATIGCVFPSCVIVMGLALIYYRFRGLSMVQGILAGLRPAVIAMIASAGINLFFTAVYGTTTLPVDLGSINVVALAIFLGAFVILRKWKVNPIKAMVGSGIAGVILFSLF